MKLTKTKLKRIIKEELANLTESPWLGKPSPIKRTPVWTEPEEEEDLAPPSGDPKDELKEAIDGFVSSFGTSDPVAVRQELISFIDSVLPDILDQFSP